MIGSDSSCSSKVFWRVSPIVCLVDVVEVADAGRLAGVDQLLAGLADEEGLHELARHRDVEEVALLLLVAELDEALLLAPADVRERAHGDLEERGSCPCRRSAARSRRASRSWPRSSSRRRPCRFLGAGSAAAGAAASAAAGAFLLALAIAYSSSAGCGRGPSASPRAPRSRAPSALPSSPPPSPCAPPRGIPCLIGSGLPARDPADRRRHLLDVQLEDAAALRLVVGRLPLADEGGELAAALLRRELDLVRDLGVVRDGLLGLAGEGTQTEAMWTSSAIGPTGSEPFGWLSR